MTPDEARALLDGTTPGDEWYYQVKWGAVQYIEPVTVIPGGEVDVTEDDAALIVAAPEMAAMIAGMHEEWGYKYEALHGLGRVAKWGFKTKDAATRDMHIALKRHWHDHQPIRIVRRYVTTEEEA